MAISVPTVGTSVLGTTAATSATLDFTAAGVGDMLFAGICLADSQASAPSAPAGWTLVQGSEGTSGATSSRLLVFYRRKVSGDTTQAFTWGTSCKYTAIPIWWPGATGVEGAAYLAHTVSSANFTTASITPTAGDRWVATFTEARSTTAIRTFTPDAALTERSDQCQGGTNPWPTLEINDSNGAVTQAAHSYTNVCSGAESHGGTIVLALIPTLSAAVSDSLTAADTAVARVALARASTDALSGVDAPARATARARAGAETLTGVDGAAGTATTGRSVGDSLTAADSADRGLTIVGRAGDTLTLSDAAGARALITAAVADALSSLDSSTRYLTLTRPTTDQLATADIAAGRLGAGRAVADALNAVDAAGAARTAAGTAADTLSLTDGAARGPLGVVRVVFDAMLLGDVVLVSLRVQVAPAYPHSITVLPPSGTITAAAAAQSVTDTTAPPTITEAGPSGWISTGR